MRRSFTGLLAGVAGLLTIATAPYAQAVPLSPLETLQQFNLVVFGDLDSQSSVEGRTLVGGNLKGNSSDYFTRGSLVGPSSYGALTVGGNITGGYKNVNNGGNAFVAGNVQNMNMNGGKAFIGGSVTGNVNGSKVTGAVVEVPDVRATMKGFAADLATLAANSVATVSSNKGTFAATPDASGTAIFNIANGASFFNSFGEITFSLNGADTVIINVGGSTVSLADNFLGGIGKTIAPVTLWNFYEATSISVGAEFWGTMLAPYATLTNTSAINGSIVTASFTQRGQVHLPTFTGQPPSIQVSEPAPWLLLGAGLLGATALRHRAERRRARA
jgi:choice-of-anchor A domain-containing protein